MVYDFNADEIFEMAEQIERNGASFYRKSAEAIADTGAKKLLLNLAAMEDEHEKTFANLRTGLSKKEKTTTVFDPEDEIVLYLRALADTMVFFEKKIDTSSMEEILKEAIQSEKASIVFYLGMKEIVPENLGKTKINQIIKEEMSHIKLLGKKLVAS
ncbi:MAG: ferritin family protein [Deltaproteobacteria bacterium]|nr:ferritin family protein [Deltaproteobacteria bacterium]MBW2663421.1 ferritin family protein [Deltaproteobacteria bacterium]